MAACDHGAGYASCPPKKVSHEFNQADKGTAMLHEAMKRLRNRVGYAFGGNVGIGGPMMPGAQPTVGGAPNGANLWAALNSGRQMPMGPAPNPGAAMPQGGMLGAALTGNAQPPMNMTGITPYHGTPGVNPLAQQPGGDVAGGFDPTHPNMSATPMNTASHPALTGWGPGMTAPMMESPTGWKAMAPPTNPGGGIQPNPAAATPAFLAAHGPGGVLGSLAARPMTPPTTTPMARPPSPNPSMFNPSRFSRPMMPGMMRARGGPIQPPSMGPSPLPPRPPGALSSLIGQGMAGRHAGFPGPRKPRIPLPGQLRNINQQINHVRPI